MGTCVQRATRTGKPARPSLLMDQYAASWSALSIASGESAHGAYPQSWPRPRRTTPHTPLSPSAITRVMPRSAGPWKVVR